MTSNERPACKRLNQVFLSMCAHSINFISFSSHCHEMKQRKISVSCCYQVLTIQSLVLCSLWRRTALPANERQYVTWYVKGGAALILCGRVSQGL